MEINIRDLRSRPKYQEKRYQEMSDEEFAQKYTAAMKKNGTDVTVTGLNETPDLETTSALDDITKAIGSGANSALAGIIGLPGALTNTVEMGLDKIGMGFRDEDERAFGFPEANAAINNVRGKLKDAGLDFLAGTDPTYQPQTRAGRFTKLASELAASGGAGAGRKMLQTVAAPTLMSEGGRELAEGTILETPAQIGGLLLGGKTLDVFENNLAGGKVAPSRLDAVKTLEDAGVQPTAGQATGQRSLAFAEEATEPGKAKRQAAIDQFTDAAITTAIPPMLRDRISFSPNMMPQEKMATLRTVITKTMDDLAGRNAVPITDKLFEEMFDIAQDYKKTVSTGNKTPFFDGLAELMVNQAGAGQINGAAFQRIRTSLSELTKTDAVTRSAAVKTIKLLEDALGERIKKSKNKDDMQLYRDVRKGYSDLMVLEAAAKRNNNVEFNITPNALAMAARNKDAQSYVYGRDTFSDLYRAGNTILTRADNPSGTARTLQALQPYAAPMTAAATTTLATGVDPLVTISAFGALPLLRNRALQSDPMQKYFKSTMRPGEPSTTSGFPGILVGLQDLQQAVQ